LFCSYEERNRSLDSVSSRYKESTTFEDFASRIYNPMPLSTLGTLRESNASSAGAPLAAALIDHNRASVKGKYSEYSQSIVSFITVFCIL